MACDYNWMQLYPEPTLAMTPYQLHVLRTYPTPHIHAHAGLITQLHLEGHWQSREQAPAGGQYEGPCKCMGNRFAGRKSSMRLYI